MQALGRRIFEADATVVEATAVAVAPAWLGDLAVDASSRRCGW